MKSKGDFKNIIHDIRFIFIIIVENKFTYIENIVVVIPIQN